MASTATIKAALDHVSSQADEAIDVVGAKQLLEAVPVPVEGVEN